VTAVLIDQPTSAHGSQQPRSGAHRTGTLPVSTKVRGAGRVAVPSKHGGVAPERSAVDRSVLDRTVVERPVSDRAVVDRMAIEWTAVERTAAETIVDTTTPAHLRSDLPCQVHDADLWFSDTPAGLEEAKVRCAACPLRPQCLEGALARREPWGVWGGEIFERGVVIGRKRPRGRPRKVAA